MACQHETPAHQDSNSLCLSYVTDSLFSAAITSAPPHQRHHMSARAYQRKHITNVSACTSARPHHKCQCLHGKQQRHHSATTEQHRTSAPAEKTQHTTPASHRALPRFQHLPVSHTNLSVVFMLLPCVTHILLSAQHSHRTSADTS